MELINIEIEKEDGSKLKTEVPKGLFCNGCQHFKIDDNLERDGVPYKVVKCIVLLPEIYAKIINKDENEKLVTDRIKKCQPCKKACYDQV